MQRDRMNETKQTAANFKPRKFLASNLRTVVFSFIVSLSLFCKEGTPNEDLTKTIGALLNGNDPSVTSDSPILNDLSVNTFNTIGGDRVIQIGFSFKNKPNSTVATKAYIGHPDIMKLSADGLTVKSFIKENLSPDSPFPDRFTFIVSSQILSYKIIVISVNSFGKSTKEIIATASVPVANPGPAPNPNNPNPPECDGAVSAPTTIGNCSGHCIQVTKNGTVFEFTAKDTISSVKDYFYLGLGLSRPSGVPILSNFLELGIDIENNQGATIVLVPASTYSTPKITFDFQNYDTACIEINSYRAFDSDTEGYSDSFVSKKILLP
ncbi:hypothetical protein [Leptospira adleri]|uniref:hypothetical protein n=1 Tax=Leptospira adleri TaxID=2023186 RepID=UPI001082A4A6|nr:hypothetical protein [Leptospira adleri]TGM57873.1 hypothetical protein EHQ97_09320 [Leptospira adleri]